MIVLHGIWTSRSLQVFGERPFDIEPSRRVGPDRQVGPSDRSRSKGPQLHPSALSEDELRRVVGDLCDSLLVTGATGAELTLLLPTQGDRPLPSETSDAPAGDTTLADSTSLRPWRLASLAFPPVDAIEFLTTLPAFEHCDLHPGASLRYWATVGRLVQQLLARQQFVPDVYRRSEEEFQGVWRAVLSGGRFASNVKQLIECMPPVCRSFSKVGCDASSASDLAPPSNVSDSPAAAELIESFLWRTVDGVVRRCIEGDELAQAIQEREREAPSLQSRWLASLVRADPTITGPREDSKTIQGLVDGWVSRLETDQRRHQCRTCFRLHEPDLGDAETDDQTSLDWKLTFHVQSIDRPEWVLDAEQAYAPTSHGPAILGRPFESVGDQLRKDIARAAEHFAPLRECLDEANPTQCLLTLSSAHRFLREATSLLELEGFGVWTPSWWMSEQPQIGLRMNLQMAGESEAPDGQERTEVRDDPCGPGGLGMEALVDFNWTLACGDHMLDPAELSTLIDANVPLVNLRGQWVEIDHDAASKALRFIRDQSAGRTTIFDAIRQAHLPGLIDAGLPVLGVNATGWIQRLLDSTSVNLELEKIEPPPGLNGTLRHYQLAGLAWLDFLDRHSLGACLADDMGLGKTVQLIALLLRERDQWQKRKSSLPADGDLDLPRPGPTLVIVPMSVVGNWQRETQRFAPSLKVLVHHGLERLSGQAFVEEVAKHDMVVSTYGLVHRDFDHLNAVVWHRVVLDEAQNIKNPAAKQSRAVRALRTTHRVALTGTPVENRLSELWSIMDFLNRSFLGSPADFRRRFAVPIERHRDGKQAQRLRQLISPFILRRLKTDPNILPELPDKMENNVYCNLTKEQAAMYEALTRDILANIDGTESIQRRGLVLAAIVKLKQICNHPAHFLADGSTLPHRSGKCDRLTEMLEEVVAEGDFALVFTQFKKMGTLLQQLLQESLDREILFLHGGTPAKARMQMVDCFQERTPRTPVFILSLKAGGLKRTRRTTTRTLATPQPTRNPRPTMTRQGSGPSRKRRRSSLC